MKISFAANHGEIGGGEVMLLAMARAARELGHDVQIVAPSSPSSVLDAAIAEQFPVIGIHGDGTLPYLKGLRAWAGSQPRGLLWCNGLRPAAATTGLSNRVVHLHQQPAGHLKEVAWVATRGAEMVLVPSQLMKSQVGLGAYVMENWTQPVNISRRAVLNRSEPAVIGYLGRLSPDKGVDVLAEAVKELDRRTPGGYRLLLAGEPRFVTPEDVRKVEDSLEEVSNITTRAGWISREDFFSTVDLAVFPSVWDEPFGLVVAEAMSAGCPFVITNAGALPSVAGHDFPWVAQAADSSALATTIEDALSDYTPTQLEASSRRWRDTYSPDAGCERLATILARLEEEHA